MRQARAISKRHCLAAMASVLMCCGSGAARSESVAAFPSKPVRIVVAASPGGTSDVLARMIGEKLGPKWKQSVVIDNRPGADSNLGAELVAKSPADGYTLLLLDVSTLTMGPLIYPRLGYNPARDFAPVTDIMFSPHALVVTAGMPVNSVKELVAWSKANPGKLNFGSSSNATRLAAARLVEATGMDMQVIPYKGGAAAITAVSGGESNFLMSSLLSNMPHIKGGRIKVIAVAGEKRMAATPDIPTAIESGVPDFVTGSYQGILAPAATPPDIVARINAAVVEVLKSPEIQARLAELGAEPIADTPEQFAAFLRADAQRWAAVVKKSNLKFE